MVPTDQALFRAGALIAVACLHLAVYATVNRISEQPPLGRYWDFTTVADRWVPHIPLTSIIYYLGDLYIAIWGSVVLWRLRGGFRRAIGAYVAMILTAGVIQVLLPGRAPWPEEPFVLHGVMHRAMHLQAYAVFPSMHVALSVLPAGIAASTRWSRRARALSTLGAVLVSISTVTAREHSVLDVAGGAVLGWVCWLYWRAGAAEAELRPTTDTGGTT